MGGGADVRHGQPALDVGAVALGAAHEAASPLMVEAFRGREPAFKAMAVATFEVKNNHVRLPGWLGRAPAAHPSADAQKRIPI